MPRLWSVGSPNALNTMLSSMIAGGSGMYPVASTTGAAGSTGGAVGVIVFIVSTYNDRSIIYLRIIIKLNIF